MKDPAFLRDAEKVSLAINPVAGEDMHRLVDRIEQTPEAIVEQIRQIFKK
jgi:hypothetical protein